MVQDKRLPAITRCMDEIERCRADYKNDPLGSMLGELDWLSELHRLLHVDNPQPTLAPGLPVRYCGIPGRISRLLDNGRFSILFDRDSKPTFWFDPVTDAERLEYGQA